MKKESVIRLVVAAMVVAGLWSGACRAQVSAGKPASVDGWHELFAAQSRNGQTSAALATYQRMPVGVRTQLKGDPSFLEALGSAYLSAGRSKEAEATLEDALKLQFAAEQNVLKVQIQIELAGVLSSENHLDQAVALYKQVVDEDPGATAAWESLAGLQHTMGHDQDALDTVQRMPPATYAAAMHEPAFEITLASLYERLKKFDLAQTLLQKAATEQTSAGQKPSPAIEMQLANLYAERGQPQLAYPVYQQVLRENPERADAWAGLISALHVTGHDKEAVAQVALIPETTRAQLEADEFYRETMGAVYARLGQKPQAPQTKGGAAPEDQTARNASKANAEIERAWSLYNASDDARLHSQLMNLGGRTDLTADQKRMVQTIWTNWAARRADEALVAGNPHRAVEILKASARAFPDNPATPRQLAVAYVQAEEPHEAVSIYKAQNMTSASVGEYQTAVSAALADGDNKDADSWLHAALATYPGDPQILILAARFEQARGDSARAIEYYRSSLKGTPAVSSGSEVVAQPGLGPQTTPMRLPSTVGPQDLSVLLAPGYVEKPYTREPPYLLHGVRSEPLPAYDGTTQLVPPFATHSDASGSAASAVAQIGVAADVPAAVPAASLREGRSAIADIGATKSKGPETAEVYSPYVPYVASREIGYHPRATAVVTVQLGHAAQPPVHAEAEVTDVLPTQRYGRSAKADQAAAWHEQVVAARAERIRRLRESGTAERSGQSHPPPEETMTGVMLDAEYKHGQVPRPATPPPGYGAAPDTGSQQYPQPLTRPGSEGQTITRTRPVLHAAAAPRIRVGPPKAPVVPREVFPPAVAAASPAPGRSRGSADDASSGMAVDRLPGAGSRTSSSTPPKDADLNARTGPPVGGLYISQAPMVQTGKEQAEDELHSLEASYSGWLGATAIGRYRSGISGLDRLYGLESPAEVSFVFSKKIRLTAVAESVFLRSGALNAADFNAASVPYLGTTAANAAKAPEQRFNGIGGELQLTTKNLGLAVGYAPYELPVRNVTGRLLWNGFGNHIAVFGDREAVKDTVLSYVGLHDPGSALPLEQSPVWGGVIASTGGMRVQFGSTAASFFLMGEGGVLTGRHVLNNDRIKGSVGTSFRVKKWVNADELRLGATFTGAHYEHNEVGLSYGQGGYFSPDAYFVGAIPISFKGHSKTNFHYTIEGSLGAQTFRQSAAPLFPLDPGLQSSFVASQGTSCTSTVAETYACGYYASTTRTQFNYSFNSEASYRFGGHWYGGGFISANNSNNYDTVSAGFFLRLVFRAQRSHEGYPSGLFQLNGLRSLQMP